MDGRVIRTILRRPFNFGGYRLQNTRPHKIRLATQGDAEAIHDLTHLAYSKWVPLIGRNPLPMNVDYKEALKIHRFDLLYINQNLAALLETYPAEDCLFLENLCVSPEFQRRGLGKILLKHAEEIARETGHTSIRLDTNKLFTGNVELYHRTGYITEWEKPVTGGIHVRMRKALR